MADGRGKSSNSKKNLIPLNKRSKEDAKRIQTKGGFALQEKLNKERNMKSMLDYLLAKDIKDKNTGNTVSTLEAISIGLVSRALKGDTRAYELIRDTIGQKPIDRQELNGNIVATLEEPSIDKVKELKRLFDE